MANEGWRFDHGPDGCTWEHVNVTTSKPIESDRAFPTLLACIKDAEGNGYEAPNKEQAPKPRN